MRTNSCERTKSICPLKPGCTKPTVIPEPVKKEHKNPTIQTISKNPLQTLFSVG
jgi:hypothetical protein